MSDTVFSDMIGLTFINVIGSTEDDVMTFTSECGRVFRFEHIHDCCESVSIYDVCGDMSDLVGSPLLMSEEVSNETEPSLDYIPESHTWTFYKYATIKGSVTVRWLGTSNGYYSEYVSYSEVTDKPSE